MVVAGRGVQAERRPCREAVPCVGPWARSRERPVEGCLRALRDSCHWPRDTSRVGVGGPALGGRARSMCPFFAPCASAASLAFGDVGTPLPRRGFPSSINTGTLELRKVFTRWFNRLKSLCQNSEVRCWGSQQK